MMTPEREAARRALEGSAATVRQRLAELEALLAKPPEDVSPELLDVTRSAVATVRASLVEVDALLALVAKDETP